MGTNVRPFLFFCLFFISAGCEEDAREPPHGYLELLQDVQARTQRMVSENWVLSKRLTEVENLREVAKELSFEYGARPRLRTCQPYELESKLFAAERLLSVLVRSDGLKKTEATLDALDDVLLETAEYARKCEEVIKSNPVID